MRDDLYDKIWETLSTKLGNGVDCDYMTDQIMDIVKREFDNDRN